MTDILFRSNTMRDVSTIIPVFNRAEYVRQALDSVLAQTSPVDEIIVVDDGSTDDTPSVVRSFGPAVTYVRQDNAGAGAARNLGINRSSSRLLTFLDSDDLWPKDRIEKQRAAFDADPALEMLFGHVQQFVCSTVPPNERERLQCPPDPVPGMHVGAMMVRREVFDRIGLFETHWNVGEFISWFARAADAGIKHVIVPDVAMLRRIHDSNMVLEQRENYDDFARILKQTIDRRRGQKSIRRKRL